MAIIRHNIIFGEVDSADYGIHIGGEGTFNAPKRAVKTYSIPGRNGDLILDGGHFENVELVYTAFNYEKDLLTFAKNLSDFRNALAAQKGYQKLTDSFNPTEYRMACFVNGVEIGPIKYNTAAQFEIRFNCKPQRYLMNGDSAISVTSGDVVLNPTLFEASPLLEAEGYGDINIGGETITIQNVELGDIKISNSSTNDDVTLDVSNLNNGDAIYSNESGYPYATMRMKLANTSGSLSVNLSGAPTNGNATIFKKASYITDIRVSPSMLSGISFAKGTNKTITTTVPLSVEINHVSTSCTLTLTTTYTASTNKVDLNIARTDFPNGINYSFEYRHPAYYGTSTKTLLPSPMYIDLDLGEAYGDANGEMVSFNNAVQIPADLPTLAPGTNAITFDNTVTELKVVPRWWKI